MNMPRDCKARFAPGVPGLFHLGHLVASRRNAELGREGQSTGRNILLAAVFFVATSGMMTRAEWVSGGFSSTGRYERVETMRGRTNALAEYTHVEISAKFKTATENEPGSIFLRLKEAPLALAWDSIGGLQLLGMGDLLEDFEAGGVPDGKQEIAWKIVVSRLNEKTQTIRLQTFNPVTQRWELHAEKRLALNGLLEWVEEGFVVAGAANAQIEAFSVKTVRVPTLFIVAQNGTLNGARTFLSARTNADRKVRVPLGGLA